MSRVRTASAPVALFLFNRPGPTAAVFEAIRRARPALLFLVADGPRHDRPGDREACDAARAVVDRIDWNCEVVRDYAATNLGLKQRIESGLQRIFEQVEEAILLEDDCVPDPTFFRFCDELLARYRYDERVWSISGNNFQFGRTTHDASYYFSRNCHIWGWATWRRAWKHHDPEMRAWPTARDSGWLESVLNTPRERQYWSYIFESNFRTRGTWDYAWNFACWRNGAVHVVPDVNLVANHGFDEDATHTQLPSSRFARMKTNRMSFPLLHPSTVEVDTAADAVTEDVLFSGSLTRAFARARHRITRRSPASDHQ